MPLNTSLIGPLFETPNAPESASFLRSFERAQEQKSPLYLAQVQQAQKQVQELGFRMQKDQLDIDAAKYLQADQLAGRAQAAEIARIRAESTDDSSPETLQKIDALLAKKFTPAGFALRQDAAVSHLKAKEAKARAAEIEKESQTRLKVAEIGAAARTATMAGQRLSPGEVRAMAIRRAEDELAAAYNSGKPEAIERAETYLANVEKYQNAEHRDPVEVAQLTMLRQAINSIDRQLGDITIQWKWPELEKERKKLQYQLENWGKSGPVSESTAPAVETGVQTNAVKRLRFVPGQGFIPQ